MVNIRTCSFLIIYGVYAPAQARENEQFWDHLIRMNNVIDLPWMLVGDFDELEFLSNKRGVPLYLCVELNI